MTRDEAVQRLNEMTGFRTTGHSLTSVYEARLREAQRDLEKGKTLPWFLLEEDEVVTLSAAASTAALPSGFLRISDEHPLYFYEDGSELPTYLQPKRSKREAILANVSEDNEAGAPTVYVIRLNDSLIDFVTTADQAYTLRWSYYKAADLLTSNVENAWLEHAPEWLIGEAGVRLARDLRDPDALAIAEALRQSGRAAIFGEEIAQEEAGGPLYLGENV